MPKAIRTVLLLFLSSVAETSAMARTAVTDAIPALEIPGHLKPYTDVNNVLSAIDHTISLLATTKYDIDLNNVREGCRREETLAILRGTIIAHGAHKAFVNTIELGWPSMDRSVATVAFEDKDTLDYRTDPALTHTSRKLLWVFWTPERMQKMVAAAEKIRTLPSNVKPDLKAFLEFLLASRQWHEMIRDRSNEAWLRTLDTQEKDYNKWREAELAADQRRKGEMFLQEAFDEKWPRLMHGSTLSDHLVSLQKDVLGPNDQPIIDCEPPRVLRRLIGLSQAASFSVSSRFA